jgi:epoxyqueuosine reductase
MSTKQDVIDAARKAGFKDIGFTTSEPFNKHREFLTTRQEEYEWAESVGLQLKNGTDPKSISDISLYKRY